ncbi:gene transfer agent family protein [Sphingomonas oryzagri]|uniref:Gene transfer agent family protein n=1 Tax=Sphingomonas oryzagri TaxID=3042314 RepID=A0ABT6N2N6_9SPHN|nr:gene transfer agent family protein [Sphingomonas oryzagri]MDH7639579.1 gene transfer agent family protein [Sphingomonas oryzagri]
MSAPANPARGETALAIGDRTLTVRPSFQALVAAEQEVGPLFALVEQAAVGKLTLADTITLIFHCLVGKPDTLTSESFGEQVVEAGIAVLTPVLRTLLGQIVKGL